jgi:4-hydroxy-2-oxoheptanedioate aldolase
VIPSPENSLRRQISTTGVAFGAWTVLPSAFSVELCLDAGFEFVGIDLQHGLLDTQSLSNVLIACGNSNVTPLVRVAPDSAHSIGLALDLGAHGVIVPLVNTPDDATRAVRAVRYPPEGERSFGPTRSRLHVNRDRTTAQVNDEVLCFVMIETPEGVANVDAICAVSGVDGIYLGPSDLAVNLDAGRAHDPRRVRGATEAVRAAAVEHGLLVGIHAATGTDARSHREQGFHLISIASDAAILRSAYAAELAAARG